MSGSMLEEVLGKLTPPQALAGRRYLSEVGGDGGPATLAIKTPWPPPSPPLNDGTVRDMLLALDEALGDATVSRLDLRSDDLAGGALEEVFATGWFTRVREVRLGKATAKALAALAAGGASVELLDLSHVKVGKGVAKLSGLRSLTTLHLGHAGMDVAATTLLAAAQLPALTRLVLGGWGGHLTAARYHQQIEDGHFVYPVVDAALASALLKTDLATRLTHLTISDAKLDTQACRVFGNADLRSLEGLTLNEAHLDDARALLSNPLPALQHLERSSGFPGGALADAKFVPQLRSLTLGGSGTSERDVCAVLRRAVSLRALDLRGMGLGYDTATALVETAPPLTELRLAWNALGDQSAALLCRAPFVPNLTVFSLSNNAVGEPGVSALAGAELGSLRRIGLGGLALTNDEVAPLFQAAWLPSCTGITLLNNQLDDAIVPQLTQLPAAATLFVDNNHFSPEGIAALQAHFGAHLVTRRQKAGPLKPRPLFDEVFGLELHASPRKPADPQPPRIPEWIEQTGLRIVGSSSRAHVAVQPDPRGGGDRLVVLLHWQQQTVPLGVRASALPEGGRVPCGQCFGDGPLVLAVPGVGVYAVDVYKGKVRRLGDVGATVEAVTDVSSSDGTPTSTAILHGTAGKQTLDLYVPSLEPARRAGITELAGFRACDAGVHGGLVIIGPGHEEEGPIRFFAVSPEHGLAPMGGLDRGFTQVRGGVARGEHMWTPAGVTAAARPAFQRRDDARP